MSYRILLAGPKPELFVPFAVELTQRGFEVRTATTGLGCLTTLHSWHPDLLVMNPDLMWGSGIGVLGVMYEEESVPVIPVVLVVDDPVRVRADLRPGWNCHLLRQPITCRDLSEFATEILQPTGPRSVVGANTIGH